MSKLKIYLKFKGGYIFYRGIKLIPWLGKNGYLYIDFYDGDSNRVIKAVHRVIAFLKVPNPNKYPIVLHKDNNKLNNAPDNLIWGTYLMNNQQRKREGRNNHAMGARVNAKKGDLHPKIKATSQICILIKNLKSQEMTHKQIQAKLPVLINIRRISRVLNNHTHNASLCRN